MVAPGRLVWAINPRDAKQKKRPALVLWVEGDTALVVFGQSFDSKPGEPAFALDPKPHRGVPKHRTYFYADADDMLIVPADGLEATPFTLTKDEYRLVAQRLVVLGYPPGLGPPGGAARIAPSAPQPPSAPPPSP